jgi:hypothetical protein
VLPGRGLLARAGNALHPPHRLRPGAVRDDLGGPAGAAAETLHGIVDPLAGREQQVQLVDNGWIDEQLGIDIDVRALASYLEQPMLPLRLARELFLKTFIGAAT